jgi:hypothetical protein
VQIPANFALFLLRKGFEAMTGSLHEVILALKTSI